MADPTAVITVVLARRAGHSVQLESITHRFGATTAVDDTAAVSGVLIFSTALLVVIMDRVVGLTRRIS